MRSGESRRIGSAACNVRGDINQDDPLYVRLSWQRSHLTWYAAFGAAVGRGAKVVAAVEADIRIARRVEGSPGARLPPGHDEKAGGGEDEWEEADQDADHGAVGE